jgi:hypothetical protein
MVVGMEGRKRGKDTISDRNSVTKESCKGRLQHVLVSFFKAFFMFDIDVTFEMERKYLKSYINVTFNWDKRFLEH